MIKKGDKVIVLAGKDKKKDGEIIEIDRKSNRAKVKGINIVAKKLCISVDTGKGYRALANISEDGGQEVPHLHFHLFGGERVGKMVE